MTESEDGMVVIEDFDKSQVQAFVDVVATTSTGPSRSFDNPKFWQSAIPLLHKYQTTGLVKLALRLCKEKKNVEMWVAFALAFPEETLACGGWPTKFCNAITDAHQNKVYNKQYVGVDPKPNPLHGCLNNLSTGLLLFLLDKEPKRNLKH